LFVKHGDLGAGQAFGDGWDILRRATWAPSFFLLLERRPLPFEPASLMAVMVTSPSFSARSIFELAAPGNMGVRARLRSVSSKPPILGGIVSSCPSILRVSNTIMRFVSIY
jgi:hypothetical protein